MDHKLAPAFASWTSSALLRCSSRLATARSRIRNQGGFAVIQNLSVDRSSSLETRADVVWNAATTTSTTMARRHPSQMFLPLLPVPSRRPPPAHLPECTPPPFLSRRPPIYFAPGRLTANDQRRRVSSSQQMLWTTTNKATVFGHQQRRGSW